MGPSLVTSFRAAMSIRRMIETVPLRVVTNTSGILSHGAASRGREGFNTVHWTQRRHMFLRGEKMRKEGGNISAEVMKVADDSEELGRAQQEQEQETQLMTTDRWAPAIQQTDD